MYAWLVHTTKLVAMHEASNDATCRLERSGKPAVDIALSFEGSYIIYVVNHKGRQYLASILNVLIQSFMTVWVAEHSSDLSWLTIARLLQT